MKKSYLALVISAALTTTAFAAEEVTNTTEEDIEVIEVTGVLSSLKEAQEIKKMSNNIVDALVAEDIGKFPDSNVAEAMQRIPGVSVNRNNGEGQTITVRGLTGDYNVTTLNGRRIASEAVNRDFNYDLIAAELIGGVQINKTQQANLPEGGIGAVINIETLKPLDVGSRIAGSLEGYYNDRAEETDPQASFLISETFNDDEFGVLFSANYTSSFTRFDSNSAQWGWNEWTGEELLGAAGDPNETVRFPSWPNIMVSTDERERSGATLALQWRPTADLDINFDALYTNYNIVSTGNMISLALFEGTNLDNIQGYTKGDDGHSNSLTIGEPGNMDSPAIAELLEAQNPRDSNTYQIGTNINYIYNNFNFNVDVSYSEAEDASAGESWIVVRTAIDTLKIDWDNGTDVPDIVFGDNQSILLDENLDYGAWYNRVRGDKVKDKAGNFNFDGTYEPDDNIVSKVLFGTGYTLQDKSKTFWQQKNPSAYAIRNGVDPGIIDAPDSEKVDINGNPLWGPLPEGVVVAGDFSNFMGNTSANVPQSWGGINVPNLFSYLRGLDNAAFEENLIPVPSLQGGNTYGVKEETIHAYGEIILEDEIAGMPWMMDFGLRYIKTDVSSWGYSQDPQNIEFDEDGLLTDAAKEGDLYVEFTGSYDKWLPSFNSKLVVTDEVVLRFSLSQAMSRPPMTNLSPNTSIWQDENLSPPKNFMWQNDPGLEPYYADQLDTAIEWYYSETGTLNFATFYKELNGFVDYQSNKEMINGVEFEITSPYNNAAKQSIIRGYEINWLQTFDEFLPTSLAGFGISANYTYNNSESGNYAGVFNEDNICIEDCVELPFIGLSENQYNIVGFYEQHDVIITLAYNYRDEYSLGTQGYWSLNNEGAWVQLKETIEVDEWAALDFQASYAINKNITITFDANNLLDPDYKQYLGGDKTHVDYISSWGRSYRAGVRFSF